MPLTSVTADDISSLKQNDLVINLNEWPDNNCMIVIDDTLVIKLSEFGEKEE